MSRSLYDEDFVRWSEEQARAIRDAGHAGTNLPIDWANVAEEIESLGKSDRRELASRIRTIIAHLLKLEASPAEEPRAGWHETIAGQRAQIEDLLKDSPSLRAEIAEAIAWAFPRALDQARLALEIRREQPKRDLSQTRYTEDQILGSWFPQTPDPLSRASGPRRRSRKSS